MADVFLSYASEDRPRAEPIVRAMEAAGLTVWWDLHIGIGSRFDMQIENELEDSGCVVVLWSPHSIMSDWVRAEAGEGLERGRLVQVLLDEQRPPLVFRQQQGFRLTSAGQDLAPLLDAIRATVHRAGPEHPTTPRQSLWLIADLENRTSEPLLTGSPAAALEIGLDHLTDLFLYPRDALLSLAGRFQAYLPAARKLAEREGLDYVLGGSIDASSAGYVVTLDLLDLGSSSMLSRSADPVDLDGVSAALAMGLHQLMEDLERSNAAAAVSAVRRLQIQCVHEDLLGVLAQSAHDHQDAITHFRNALGYDSTFVPSYLGLAISCDCLDQQQEGSAALDQTLEHLDGLSERERLRTQSMYYLFRSENYHKALELIQALSKISPLEVAAINNEALARCNLLDFKGAVATLTRAVSLAPDEPFYRTNLALYSMYAGELEQAVDLARGVIGEGMESVDARIALGCSLYAMGEEQEAVTTFERLSRAEGSDRVPGLFALADLAMAGGDLGRAQSLLDEVAGQEQSAETELPARLTLMRAEILIASARHDQARGALSSLFEQSDDLRMLAAGAIAARDIDDQPLLGQATDRVKRRLDPHAQAYRRMLEGLQAEVRQDYPQAEQALRDAIEIADLWILHYLLAGLYAKLDMGLEAKLERDICLARSGEGVTAWINRMPTCRYLARMRR